MKCCRNSMIAWQDLERETLHRPLVDGAATVQSRRRGGTRPVKQLLHDWKQEQTQEDGARLNKLDNGRCPGGPGTDPLFLASWPRPRVLLSSLTAPEGFTFSSIVFLFSFFSLSLSLFNAGRCSSGPFFVAAASRRPFDRPCCPFVFDVFDALSIR